MPYVSVTSQVAQLLYCQKSKLTIESVNTSAINQLKPRQSINAIFHPNPQFYSQYTPLQMCMTRRSCQSCLNLIHRGYSTASIIIVGVSEWPSPYL
ncbi:predicted protein [Botrytis cinerea T4]|uniref:Uncharacterized protein n=1 Tax=Botryotinia fuckeliana (strain T4) TaxID=999810 RepID=G2YGT5_BOTF4|nr:predicted protein [Botrytis cinerea T4]